MTSNILPYKKFIAFAFASVFVIVSFAQKPKKLGLIFDETTYNFGDVEMWENQPALFTFTNKSNQAITILPIFSENDLEVIFPEKPIAPYESFTVKAIYYTAGKGSFSRKFPLYFSMIPEPILLTIKGNIKSLSPTAYIQCPTAKPMHSKANKVDLIGSVVEINSGIPLSGSMVKLIGQNNTTLFSDQSGEFGTKLPTGTYQIVVEHPTYEKHISSLYIGNTTGRVKINLIPKATSAILAKNKIPEKEVYEQKTLNEAVEPFEPKAKQNEVPVKSEPTKNYGNDNLFGNNIPTFNDTEKNKTADEDLKSNIFENTPLPKQTIKTTTPEKRDYYKAEKTEIDKEQPIAKEETLTFDYSKSSPNSEKKDYPQPENEYNQQSNLKQDELRESYHSPTFTYENEKPVKEDYDPYKRNSYSNSAPKKELTPTDYASSYVPPSKRNKEKDESIFYQPKVENELYKSAPTKEVTESYYNPTKNPVSSIKKFTVKVVDNKSMVPIEDALLHINILNNVQSEKYYTDGIGAVDFETGYENLRVVASADGYISSEIKISTNDEDGIYRIYLDPVSNLYDEIYSKIDDKLANQALNDSESLENEIEVTPVEEVNESQIVNQENNLAIKEDERNEAEILAKISNQEEEIPKDIVKEIKPTIDEKLLQKQDSLERFIENLLAEQQAMMNKLNKVENEKSELKDNLSQQEAEKEALLAKAKKEALEKERELLENEALAKKETEKMNPELSRTSYTANNIVFLVDISSSMAKENRMDLLKQSIKSLIPKLRDIDRVAIIAYNQKTDLVLESIEGTQKTTINNAIDKLEPFGLTYGVNGIQQAYEILEFYYRGDGNNQIILATDGLFSEVNQTMTERELFKLVRQKANQDNIKLSVVGFGKEDEGDNLMNKLASNGKGKFIKIKNPWEAETVLIEEIEMRSRVD